MIGALIKYLKRVNNNLNQKYEKQIAFFIYLLFWLLLLVLSGTIKSGYHFTDDHEILSINEQIKLKGFWATLLSFIENDLQIRFRVFYYMFRISLTQFLGVNLFLWSLVYLLMAILTSFNLFLFCYKQGFNFILSLVFPFIVLIGPQAAIWWRLGPCESLGMLLLSISLNCLVSSINKGSKNLFFTSIVVFILLALTKESFLLLTPFYMVLLLWLRLKMGCHKSFKMVFVKSIMPILLLTTFFIISNIIIIFFIGTNKIGYAGVDNKVGLNRILIFTYDFIVDNQYASLIAFGLFLYLQNIKQNNLSIIRNIFASKFVFESVTLVLITLPQFVLYHKSGFSERYLLPLNFGFAYFIVFLFREIISTKIINNVSVYGYSALIVILLWSILRRDTWQSARMFAKEGINTNKFIQSITKDVGLSDTVLLIVNPVQNYEWAYSLRSNLCHLQRLKNVYFYPVKDTSQSLDSRFLADNFNKKHKQIIIDKIFYGGIAKIAVLPFDNMNKDFLTLDSQYGFAKENIGAFIVYSNKKVY